MKKHFLISTLAALALAAGAADAQQTPAQPGADAVAVISNTNLCDWFRHDDRLAWDVVTAKTADDWQTAVASLARDYKTSEAEASRKLVSLCRSHFTQAAARAQ